MEWISSSTIMSKGLREPVKEPKELENDGFKGTQFLTFNPEE
jgi:hypothetical protein